MFVSKKKYNALKEKYMKYKVEVASLRTALDEYLCEINVLKAGLNKQIQNQKDIVTKYESKQVPEGRRLTAEELSTLIAVDLIRILNKEANKDPFSDAEKNAIYGIHDLEEGLFNE